MGERHSQFVEPSLAQFLPNSSTYRGGVPVEKPLSLTDFNFKSIHTGNFVFLPCGKTMRPSHPYRLPLPQNPPKGSTTSFVPWQFRGSATHCVRGGMVVTRTEAKGEYGRREPRWGYVARCVPPIFPSPAATARTSFRHTPTCPWPRQTATVWRNLQQNRQHTRIHYSSFIIHHSSFFIVFHLLRQRKGLRNRPKLLWLTVLQQRFGHLVERGPAKRQISFAESACLLRGQPRDVGKT